MVSAIVVPKLAAYGVSNRPPYSKTFTEGTSSKGLVKRHLTPECIINSNKRQSGAYLELYNENTGLVMGKETNFDGAFDIMVWNDYGYPVFTKKLSGVYRCRTDTAKSKEYYNLTVVGKGRWRIECIWAFLRVLFLNLYTCLGYCWPYLLTP